MSDNEFTVPPKRWYTHYGKLCVTYRWKYHEWLNDHFNQQPWHMVEEWFVCIGFSPSTHGWFGVEDAYYDGHIFKSVSFFGVVAGYGFTYDSRPKA